MAAPTVDRERAVRRATALNRITIGWNALEGLVAVAAGLAAGSVSLIGFGLDSGIEVSAALVLAWRLANERKSGCQQPADDRARQLIALSFAALALYVGATATLDLLARDQPDASVPGIVIASLSLIVMPVLAADKRRQAIALGSQAARAEAAQTDVCTLLSAALLVGLVANAALGWWWADPMAGLVIAAVSGAMAYRTATSEALADTCLRPGAIARPVLVTASGPGTSSWSRAGGGPHVERGRPRAGLVRRWLSPGTTDPLARSAPRSI